MQVVHTRAELLAWHEAHPAPLGFVPTMGNLHAGHLALVTAAQAENAQVAVSIFVNPTQFGPNEDFSAYPRTLDSDIAVLEAAGCDLLLAPTAATMYPAGTDTRIVPGAVGESLCGPFRPGHFSGVATVVATLWHLVQPQRAYFGTKDWQQCMVLRRLLLDLAFPLEMVLVPTKREADGLAMSSRNQYLSAAERSQALQIHRALTAAVGAFQDGERHPATLQRLTLEVLSREADLKPQYVAVVDAETLQPITGSIGSPTTVAIAAHLGKTRLIDNCVLGDVTPLLRTCL
ncbi:MAG: pantoate--beta-alanine ligase [Candidatus Sericytochromatia bacterium]|nr:pantoate--beta-alanine ligase [Candidatus Sericytochromatia bacterium]